MKTSFERFKDRNTKRMDAQANLNTHFIFKGYPSIKITSGNEAVQAAVVNKQEQDKAYIYTQLQHALNIGSIWSAKSLHWLVAEEIITIKDVNWHKYLAYLCNIEVENTWGYFIGPEKTYINIKNEYGASLESLQKPVLVLPVDILGFSDKIVIKERPWLVQEWDAISSPGLVYYSLRATTISKEEIAAHEGMDVYIIHAKNQYEAVPITPEKEEASDEYIIAPTVNIVLATEEGFFKYSNPNIKIVKRSATEVIFNLPFGVSSVEVQFKQANEIITRTYKAVE